MKLLPISKSRLFEGEIPHIFIVMVALQNILSYSPRSNSVEGQMSKSLDGQIPQIANSYYLCMVICCESQGYIARPVDRSKLAEGQISQYDLFSLYYVTFN